MSGLKEFLKGVRDNQIGKDMELGGQRDQGLNYGSVWSGTS